MTKRRLTEEELKAHREEHLRFLHASANAFDGGEIGGAKRLAVSLRVLLHQTAGSQSIAAQIGERTGFWPAYSFAFDPKNLLAHQGLVRSVVTIDEGGSANASFRANLSDVPTGPRPLRFSTWWDDDIVLSNTKAETFTRRRIVLYAANKDGGAHVDPDLDLTFAALRDGSGSGTFLKSATNGVAPLTNVVAHSIRQVAFEVLRHYGKA